MFMNVHSAAIRLDVVARRSGSAQPPPVSFYLEKLMRAHIAKTGDDYRSIGAAAKVSSGTVSNVLKVQRFDAETVERLARFFGIDPPITIYTQAQEWWEKEGRAASPPPPSPAPTDPYVTRPPTLEWARKVGYPEAVIDQVASLKRRDGLDPGGPGWVKLLDAFMARYEAGEDGEILGDDEAEGTRPKVPPKRLRRR